MKWKKEKGKKKVYVFFNGVDETTFDLLKLHHFGTKTCV